MLAVRRGDVQTVTELATSISCIQTHNAVEDWTALHEAAYYGQAACVKALLKGKPVCWMFRIVQNVQKSLKSLSFFASGTKLKEVKAD